jgi:DNA-binding response OmpR family regulator
MHQDEPTGARTYRILAVDDDLDLLATLETLLTDAGFEVITASSGPAALQTLQQHGIPHLAVIDLLMHGMDGRALAETMRSFVDVPIIFLTAVGDESTVVESLARLADDYITKPFRARELVARIRRVLERVGDYAYTLQPCTYVDDRLTVDFSHQRITVDDQPVALTPMETKLLYILMSRAGATVTNDFLVRRLWPQEDVFEDALRVHVSNLRRKIESDPSRPRYIVTERYKGYTFAAPIRRS